MKKRITFLMAAFTLLAFLAIPMGVWGQTRVEEVYSTCLFGSDYNSQSVGSYTATWTATNEDYTWTIVNGNNNNNAWNFVKFGRKNNASVGEITTTEAYDLAITKVDLTIDAITAANVNSIKLYSSTDNNTWTEVGSFAKSTGLQTVTVASPAADQYYMIKFDCASGSANGLVTVSKVEYYYNTSGASSPTISADNVELAYDATSGAIEYTVNNPVQGGELTAATNAEWLTIGTIGDDAVPFTCTVNEGFIRTAAVALTYSYGNEIVTKNVTVTQDANPNGPGSQDNPYTVAQARAAIDANAGTQGVYATGIVSAIPTAYNSTYGNITFNMVDEVGDEVFLQAYRCGGDEAANVAVGDVAVVYGNLTKYASTYEFGQDCEVVSLTHPAVAVEAPTFSPVAGTYAEVQTVAISSETEGTDIYYTLDGTDPTMESAMYENPITVSETTTIKAIAVNGDNVASNVASANYYFCSADDPYTVTEALAFQAYQYPANGIYVHGIVSTAPTQAPTNNGELTYYISVDGEAANQLEVYKGKGLEQAAFTAQDDLQVGDIVTVYGNVQVYNSTIEFASGNYLVSFERPEVPVVPSITVTPATVEVDAEEHDGTLDLAYENLEISDMTDFDIQYYDAEGEETETPDWIEVLVAEQDPEIGEGYVVSYYMFENEGEARSAYFKVFAAGDEDFVYSNLVTVNQDAYVAPVLDYATLPFEFNGGKADIEGTDGLTQEGLDTDYSSSPKLKFNTTGDWLLLHFNEQPGTLTFDIKGNGFSGGTFTVQTSEDGETYTDLATYTDISTNGQSEEFTNLGENVRYIKWIYTEKVNGNVALGNIVLDEYTGPVASITVADATVSVPAEGAEGTLTVTYENITEIIADVYFCDADGQEFTYEWMTAEIDDDNNVEYLVEPNEGEARTAYFKVYAMDDEGELVYSNLVTVNQEGIEVPPTGDEYALYTGELVEGDYLIVYGGGAMNTTVTNDRLQYEDVTVNNDVIVTDNAAIVWHIAPSGQYWTIYNANADAYAASTGAKNKAQMLADGTDDKALWTVSGTETYEFVNKANSEDNVNANLRRNGTYGFACYATSTGGALSLYKKVDLPANSIVIEGYGDSERGGYYLIASPFTVSPTDVQGMTEGEYDLYSFDEAEEDEWRNYKAGAFENLEPGKGYLYAHSTDVTLTFDGEAYNGDPIVLKKTAGCDFEGWNLVGNPYTGKAYIDRDFYVMNPQTGDEIITGEGNEIAAMQGFFVIADHDGEELEISTEPTEEGGKIVMNVNSNRGNIIDRAMIRFGEGRQLPKFMLNEDNTKLYIAKGEEEYAVARNEAKGEMNLNFEAAEDGTYTLDFTVENVELDQLLLIDNKTGVSIDLLNNPSYTFEANTTDNAARFCIVFGITTTVSEENVNTFAFYNNGNLILNNEGAAILNVVDVLGRVISSYDINGSESIHINAQAGVYMLQLVQGDKVSTQKIVIE